MLSVVMFPILFGRTLSGKKQIRHKAHYEFKYQIIILEVYSN